MSRRLALLTPFAFPSIRGNAVTVERIARGLRARGAPTSRSGTFEHDAVIARAAGFGISSGPDFHAFHAYRARATRFDDGPANRLSARR